MNGPQGCTVGSSCSKEWPLQGSDPWEYARPGRCEWERLASVSAQVLRHNKHEILRTSGDFSFGVDCQSKTPGIGCMKSMLHCYAGYTCVKHFDNLDRICFRNFGQCMFSLRLFLRWFCLGLSLCMSPHIDFAEAWGRREDCPHRTRTVRTLGWSHVDENLKVLDCNTLIEGWHFIAPRTQQNWTIRTIPLPGAILIRQNRYSFHCGIIWYSGIEIRLGVNLIW